MLHLGGTQIQVALEVVKKKAGLMLERGQELLGGGGLRGGHAHPAG